MANVNSNSYRDLKFYPDTPLNNFYTYSDLKDVSDKCDLFTHQVKRCRTIGILHSSNGRFFLSDLDEPEANAELLVQVSMVYLKSPLQSTVIPYPVQVFGTLHWKNRPVIFVMILQVMTVPMAIRLKNAMSAITSRHLARRAVECEDEDLN